MIGKFKGVQCDVGGYVVVLVILMDIIFGGKVGSVFFCVLDIGWVVGYLYIVYVLLLVGMVIIVYEGLLIWLDCGVWWIIVEKYQVSWMFLVLIVICVLKKFFIVEICKYDFLLLEVFYLVGELLDELIVSWVSNMLDVLVIDNYWQIEFGWLIMVIVCGLDDRLMCLGSFGVLMYGYNVQLFNEVIGELCGVNEKGMLVVEGLLLLGCIQIIWGDDGCFVKIYWLLFFCLVYVIFDWGICDVDGYYFIFGCIDDVINVVGYWLGMCEIEESIFSYLGVVEVVVVGVKDVLKGQVVVVFVILKESDSLEDCDVVYL